MFDRLFGEVDPADSEEQALPARARMDGRDGTIFQRRVSVGGLVPRLPARTAQTGNDHSYARDAHCGTSVLGMGFETRLGAVRQLIGP